jgi:hypothetical protein
MPVTCGASPASRWGETFAITFATELTGFDVDNVVVKILLVFRFMGNMPLALFARFG